jgi:hypothetical protein
MEPKVGCVPIPLDTVTNFGSYLPDNRASVHVFIHGVDNQ